MTYDRKKYPIRLVVTEDKAIDLMKVLVDIPEYKVCKYVKHRLDQLTEPGNEKLKKECIAVSGIESLNDSEAASVILKELWKRLRRTHRLRVMK